MKTPNKPLPTFANEAQERAYWETHDSTEHMDWSKARKVSLPNLKPTTKTISLRLPQHLLDSIKVAANAKLLYVAQTTSLCSLPLPHIPSSSRPHVLRSDARVRVKC